MVDEDLSEEERQLKLKKNRTYIIGAFNLEFNEGYHTVISDFLKKKNLGSEFIIVDETRDLLKLFNRNIKLMIIDDHFTNIEHCIKLAKSLKKKKNNNNSPVLFLTSNPTKLLQLHQDELSDHQNLDRYIYISDTSSSLITEEIESILEPNKIVEIERRQSARVNLNKKIRISRLNQIEEIAGILSNMSMHGAVVEASEKLVFLHNEQLQITMPISQERVVQSQYSEFIKLSATVQRVYMSANKVAIRWNHVTEDQNLVLSELLMNFMSFD